MEPLSCGKEHSVWRSSSAGGTLDGCVVRIPRRGQAGGGSHSSGRRLQDLLGQQYAHLPLREFALDTDTATTLFNAAASACNTGAFDPSNEVVGTIHRLLAAAEGRPAAQLVASAVAQGTCVVATVEVDHTQLHVGDSLGLEGSGASLCVELKPKCGALPGEPLSSVVPPQCRHCLYAPGKERRDGLARTAFCPLDLFSGEASRVRRALRAMIAVPHNNLRVFRAGSGRECGAWRALCFGASRGDGKEALLAELALAFDPRGLTRGGWPNASSPQVSPVEDVLAEAEESEESEESEAAAEEVPMEVLEEVLVEALVRILLQETVLQRLRAVQVSSER